LDLRGLLLRGWREEKGGGRGGKKREGREVLGRGEGEVRLPHSEFLDPPLSSHPSFFVIPSFIPLSSLDLYLTNPARGLGTQ